MQFSNNFYFSLIYFIIHIKSQVYFFANIDFNLWIISGESFGTLDGVGPPMSSSSSSGFLEATRRACWLSMAMIILVMSVFTVLSMSMLPLIPTLTIFPILLSDTDVGAAQTAAMRAKIITAANFIVIGLHCFKKLNQTELREVTSSVVLYNFLSVSDMFIWSDCWVTAETIKRQSYLTFFNNW